MGDPFTADDLDPLMGDCDFLSESLRSVDRKIPLRFESVTEDRICAGLGTDILIGPAGTVPVGTPLGCIDEFDTGAIFGSVWLRGNHLG